MGLEVKEEGTGNETAGAQVKGGGGASTWPTCADGAKGGSRGVWREGGLGVGEGACLARPLPTINTSSSFSPSLSRAPHCLRSPAFTSPPSSPSTPPAALPSRHEGRFGAGLSGMGAAARGCAVLRHGRDQAPPHPLRHHGREAGVGGGGKRGPVEQAKRSRERPAAVRGLEEGKGLARWSSR